MSMCDYCVTSSTSRSSTTITLLSFGIGGVSSKLGYSTNYSQLKLDRRRRRRSSGCFGFGRGGGRLLHLRLITTAAADGRGVKKHSPLIPNPNNNSNTNNKFRVKEEKGIIGQTSSSTDDEENEENWENWENWELELEQQSSSSSSSSSSSVVVSVEDDFLLEFNEKNSGRRGGGGDDLIKLDHDDETERSTERSIRRSIRSRSSSSSSSSSSRQRQLKLMKRSTIIAKQVISLQSALNLGFVSQLWVDTNSWVVLVLEVRPNLLSGEIERFLLDDVSQVGDVVLIHDESVIESEFKLFGLETLVGYTVVTPSRRNIGKVRGFTFNINSGAVESLELDSFGISIIPSTLVSTYALFVDDVLEVVSDTVVVDEAAATHIQRLTKGVWDPQNVENSIEELGDDSNLERQPVRSDQKQSRRRSFTGRKLRPKMRDTVDDWELPMDYF